MPEIASAQVTVEFVHRRDSSRSVHVGSGGCTLREAMDFDAEGEIVDLPAGTYDLTEGPLPAGGSRFLRGAGARTTTITSTNRSRVVVVNAGNVTITGVTISDGNVPEGEGGGIHVAAGRSSTSATALVDNTAETGGGIYSAGTLRIERSTIALNFAAGRNAARRRARGRRWRH